MHPGCGWRTQPMYRDGRALDRTRSASPDPVDLPFREPLRELRPMFERFTDRARRVLVMAQDECQQLGSDVLGPAHLLLGLSRDTGGAAFASLRSAGAIHQDLREQLSGQTGAASKTTDGQASFSPEAKRVMELALREALQMGDAGIGTIALLLGVLDVADTQVDHALESLGVHLHRLREDAEEMKVLEVGELAEVATRLASESDDHASIVYDDAHRVIAAFEGPIFVILSPDLGPPREGASGVGGGELTHIGVQHDDVPGRTWIRQAYIETRFLDRVQGIVALGGSPTPVDRDRQLKEVMDRQHRDELSRPPATRFKEVLDWALNDEYGERSEVVDVVSTGTIELQIEGVPTPVATWSAGPWNLGWFEGVFKSRWVGVKLGVNGLPVSECTIGFVADPRTLVDT